MFFIFGIRTKAHPMGWAPMVCPRCGQPGNALIVREVTKFSLFFVPLIPLRTKYVAECQAPMCRSRVALSRHEAQRLLAEGVRA